jgi:hypothetical protein
MVSTRSLGLFREQMISEEQGSGAGKGDSMIVVRTAQGACDLVILVLDGSDRDNNRHVHVVDVKLLTR